jgi:hypothetical protein
MVRRYAEGTSVSVEKSRAEIEAILSRYGAEAFGYATELDRAMIQFQAKNRRIRFLLKLPAKTERRFTHSEARGALRTQETARAAWEQSCRQSWRALALVIKAKLEAVTAGISEFEDEFLSQIVLADGSTVGQYVRPQIEKHYREGGPRPMLLLGPDRDD